MKFNSKWILVMLLTTCIFTYVSAQTTTPIGTSYPRTDYNVRGISPFYSWTDTDGTGDWTAAVTENVLRFTSDTLPGAVTVENTSSLGIEMATPIISTATPGAGGSLADDTYIFRLVATDGTGFTIGSSEVSCVVSGQGGSGRCAVSWSAVPGALNYRLYSGLTSGGQDRYATTGLVTAYNWDDNAIPGTHPNTAGTVPTATNAYSMRLSNTGLQFPDGTTQNVASGASNWANTSNDIYNTNTGNVCIFDSSVCAADSNSRLNIITSGASSRVFIDTFGTSVESAIIARYSRGTSGSPSAVLDDDALGTFGVSPRESGGAFSSSPPAFILFKAAENFSGSAHGTDIEFSTTPLGSTSPITRLIINMNGNILISKFTDDGQRVQVNGGVSAGGFVSTSPIAFDSTKNMFVLEAETTTPVAITHDGTDKSMLIAGPSSAFRNLRNMVIATLGGTLNCDVSTTVGTLTVKLKRNGTTLKTATVQCAGDGGSGAPETVPFTVTIPDMDDPGTCSPTCTLNYELTASSPVVAGFSSGLRYAFITVYQIP